MFNAKIDRKKYVELMIEANKRAQDAQNKSPILFIGNKGAGKSTTINLIFGCDMKVIDGLETMLTTNGDGIAASGDSMKPVTQFPQIIDGDSIVLADVPGFDKSQTSEEELCAAQGISAVIKHAESISGIVVVIDYPSLSALRGEGFIQVVNHFSEILKLPGLLTEKEKQGISFIVTKFPLTKSKIQLLAGIQTLKIKYEARLSNPKENHEEIQRQIDVLKLFQGSNLLIINEDGTGYAPDTNNLLSLQENRLAIINYLQHLPKDSLTKESFKIVGSNSRYQDALQRQAAFIELDRLSELADTDLCPVKNADQNATKEEISNVELQQYLHDIQDHIRIIAKGYLDQQNSNNFDAITAEQKILQLQKKISATLSKWPALNSTILKHLISSSNWLSKLGSAIKDIVTHESIIDAIVKIKDQFNLLKNQMRHRLLLDAHIAVKHNHEELQQVLIEADTAVTDSAAALKKLETEKVNLVAANKTTQTNLETDLNNKNTAITNLGSRPTIIAAPGNAPAVSSHPGHPAPDHPGAEPNVPGHPGNPPFGGVLHPAYPFWLAAFNHFKEMQRQHGEWCGRRDRYNNYHAALNAHNTSNAAFQNWQAANNASVNSIQARANYDTALVTATQARDVAQTALDNHKLKASQDLATKNQQIKGEQTTLHNAKVLRLLLIGANQAVKNLLNNLDRVNAIDNYTNIIDKLRTFATKLPNKLIENLELTLKNLRAEETEVTALYQAVNIIIDKSLQFTFDSNKSFAEQLAIVKDSTQKLTLNYEIAADDIDKFTTQLRFSSDLKELELSNSNFAKNQFQKLAPQLLHLPQLQSLDVSQGALDDQAGLVLLAVIYIHPNLTEINLAGNKMSPILQQLIHGVLVLKQSFNADSTDDKTAKLDSFIKDYLYAYELLSISAGANEKREFEVALDENKQIIAKHVSKSGNLQFAGLLEQIQKMRTDLNLPKPADDKKSASPESPKVFSSVSSQYNSSSFFTTADKQSRGSFNKERPNSWDNGTHWYTHEEIQNLLQHFYGENQQIELFAAIDCEFQNGTTLTTNLADRMQLVTGNTNYLLVPINLGNRHWAALTINLADRNNPTIYYADPFGNPMPQQVLNAINHVFTGVTAANIIVSPAQLQEDGYNCGPWTIEIIRSIVATQALPNGINIAEARRMQQEILTNFTAASEVRTKSHAFS